MKANHLLLSASTFYGVMACAVMISQFGTVVQPAQAADLYWDADVNSAGNNIDGTGLGGTGIWDLTSPGWWNGTTLGLWPNTGADTALFTAPPALLPTLNTVTLSSGITAGQVSFLRSGYLLTGGDLTLAGSVPTLNARFAETGTIDSQILGTGGLTMTGGGTVLLTNATNSYTGTTTISNGTLAIKNSGALGIDSSAIVVTGSTTRGVGGGALMLAGGYGYGVTLERDVTLQGLGPVPAFGSALLSVGDNTLSGTLSNGSGTLNTGISSAGGRLTLTDVTLAGTTGTAFLTVGVGSSLASVPGSGSYAITGNLYGTGSLQKSGSGTLIMSPASAAGYSGTFRIYSGSMRFESVAAFGSNAGSGTLSTLDLAGDNAILELRMDNGAIGRNVYNRGGGSPIIVVDHTIGSSAVNGTTSFGTLTYDDGESITFNGRNGFNLSFGATPVITGDGNTTFANNLNGTLTFTGDFWSDFNNTGSRVFTISGNGNTVIDGSIIATSASFNHSLVKSGTGTLTITGSASTYTGNTTVTGTLSIGSLGAINGSSPTGGIILGSTTTAGALQYTGAADTLAKPFSLAGTTGGGAILSDGTGALTITGVVGAGGVGIKTLYLGGSNTDNNTFSSFLMDNTNTNTTGLMKIGSGTWVLKESSPTLGSAGSVTIAAPGTTATTLLTLSSGTTAGLVVGQTIVLSGSTQQITGIVDSTHFTIGTGVTNTTAPAGTYNVNAIPLTSTSTTGGTWSGPLTIASGILKLQATNATSNIVPNANAVVFNVDTYTVNQATGGTLEFVGVSGLATTETLGALTPTVGMNTVRLTSGGGGAAANLIFSSLGVVGKGSGVNFSTSNGGGGTVTINGLATSMATTLAGNGHFYIDGANFARSNGGVLVAPVYGTDAGFVTSATALTAASNNQITGSFTSGAVSITSLKIAGSQTLTLSGNLTVNTGSAANDGGILQTGGASTITGNNTTVRLITTGGAGAVVIRVDGETDVLTLSSTATIASTTTGGLTKNGQGTLIIAGVNAQTGITSINEGTVQLSGSGRLSAASQQLDLRQGATLDLNGFNTGVAVNAINGAGLVTNTSTTAATFTWGNSTTGNGVFSGIIQDGAGVVNVTKGGTTSAGTFSGLNTYTGVTTIGGTTGLVSVTTLADIGVASGIGRGNDTDDTTNAASLVFAGTTGGLNYTGLTSVSIDRLFTLNGSAANSGAQIANASTNNSALIFNKTNAITFGAGATVAQTLTLGGTSLGDNLINLQITDNGALATSLNKIGTGLWKLGAAANNYTGTTTITAGFLDAQDFSSLSNNSGLILGATTTAGVLETSGDFTRNIVASGSAGVNTVSWNANLTTGGGGFSASSGKLRVALGGIGTETALTWGLGGFAVSTTATAALVLNSTTSLGEVEFRNSIDLNGAVRTILVNDNATTFTDFATITGAISGNGGISKTGTGLLQLFGANSYTGSTAVTAGTLVVNSLGNSTLNPGSTSVGDATNGNTQSGALTLGNAGTTAGILQYVGAGEISDRMIRLNTTTGNTQIVADGTGALILTNVLNDMAAGAKVLYLRGGNTQGNMITSVLANNGGNLSVTVDQGATWILGGDNTYSGTTIVSAGALGAASDTAFGAGILNPRNGTLFAYGGDRTLANALTVATTTSGGTFAFMGEYSLTLNGDWSYTNTTTGHTITNNITSGKALTINGDMVLNALTAAVTLAINGSGNTILNGDITTNKAFNINLSYSGDGTLTLAGVNTTAGTTTINNANGTVILAADNVLGGGILALTAGTLQSNGVNRTLSNNVTQGGNFIIGGSDKLTFNGTWTNSGGSRTLTVNTAAGIELAGQVNLSESATSARTLTINGTGNVLISGAISNGIGTGASALAYTGSGTLTITNGANSYTGATTLNNASGTLRLTGAGKLSTGALTVNAGNLYIESVNQSVALLTMGNVAGTTATVNIASGLTLSVTGVTFAGTTTLPSTITGAGTLDLGSAGITVTVADNITQAADMIWSVGTLTGSGVFTKAGAGVLDISGIANNNFTGTYQVNAGAIMGIDGLSNNLALNGGVYQGNGLFNRSLGTGPNQVQWLALGGGFAAVGGDLTVTLAGAPNPLVWGGTPFFVPDGAPLIFGSVMADGVTDFIHNIDLNGAVRTVSAVDNTNATTDWAVLSGVLSNGGITKTGNGILKLGGANTFAGGLTVTAGTVQFTTVSNIGGGPSNLGQGAITLNGGTLSFVGDGVGGSQSTDRTILGTATNSTLAANGTNGATITYAGNIDLTGLPSSGSLLLTGTGAGFITGGISMSGGSTDLQPQSGTWTFSGTPSVLTDDFIITGPTAVVNLNSTGVLTWGAGASTSPNIYIRGGATLNLNAENAVTFVAAGSFVIGDASSTAAVNTLNMNSFSLSLPGSLTLGAPNDIYAGVINGTGTLSIGTTIAVYRGSISANLAGAGVLQKLGMGTVTFSGDNSGLTSATGVRIDAGQLMLDYTTNNAVKLRELTGLDMRGGWLALTGSSSAATIQSVASLTLASGGANRISVTSGSGQSATLNLGAITRANGAGTLRVDLPVSGAITTTTTNSAVTGMLGTTGTAFATVNNGTGTYFAINDGSGNIAALTYAAAANDVTAWSAGANITDATTGFTGTRSSININSLRFDAAAGSTLVLAPDATLTVASGGILQTSNATGATAITGGRLTSGTGELVVTVDGAPFEISSAIGAQNILTKTGAGTLILSGSNSNTGATFLQDGVLQLSGGNAIGDRSIVTLADDHAVLLQLLANETLGGLSGGSTTAGLDILTVVDLGNHDLTINAIAASTYTGKLTGGGRLIKSGAATFSLAAVTGFTGDVVVNQGQLTLATRTIANLASVASVTLNTGSLVLDFTGGTETADKINNAASITLINTGGIDGLRANNDRNDASKAETIGALTFLGGANTVTLQESASVGSTARQITITAASVVRSNYSTLLVRGNNLGDLGTSGVVNSGRLVFTSAPALSGGGGAAGSTTISILPWAIGDSAATAATAYGNGASFGTYVATTGFRPLNLITEYEQLNAAGGVTATNNVRYSGASSLTLDGVAKTMNALLVDNVSASSGITLSGAGAALNVNSGAFLFTGAQGITLTGFSSITTGALNEYIFHVVNTSASGVTLDAPLTTGAAALTKSGAGTLILTSTGSTYAGVTTINQGVLQIDSLNKLGSGGVGGITLNGGTLRFGGVFDPTSVKVTLGVDATANVQTTTGGTFDTNGFDITLANRLGNGGNGGFTKAGAGVLTLNAAVNYTGTTTITGGTLAYGVKAALPSTTSLILSGGTLDFGSFTTTIGTLFISGTSGLTGNAPLTITGNVDVDGAVATRTLTVNNSGLTTFSGDLMTLVTVGSTARTLTLAGTGNITIASQITNGTAAGSLTYTGSGILTLTGNNTYTGTTTLNNNVGSLIFAGASQLSGMPLTVNAGFVQLNPAFDQTVGNLSMGGGGLGTSSTLMIGAGRTLTLAGTVTYTNTGNPLAATIDGGVGAILDFGGVARTFNIGDSSNAEPDMIIGANVTLQNDGGGGLIKTGAGTLYIGGTNNLTGPITIQAGSVTGNIGTGNLLLNNGVFEGSGTFTRSLGSGPGQVQWVAGASGGFAASGGDLIVTLTGAPNPLIWDGTPFFVSGAGALLFGSSTADSVVTFTHNIDLNSTSSAVTRTVTVNDNTDVTTDKAVLSGNLTSSGSGAVTLAKTGAGILELTGANTFSALTVSTGTLQFSTVSNTNGGPSNLGQGSTISIGTGILSFIGGVSQSTDRAIAMTGAGTLSANGTSGATITYTGAISTAGNTLSLTGTGEGFIAGGVSQTGSAADINVNSGIWHLSSTASALADDIFVTATSTGTAVLNLDSAGLLTYTSGNTSNGLYARDGGVINLNANDVNGASNSGGLDFIILADVTGNAATLNINTFNITLPRLDVGSLVSGRTGIILGSGTITTTYTGTDYLSGFRLFDGSVSANLAGVATVLKQGLGTVTLSGNNSGLTGTVAATRIDSGTLLLDFTSNNNNKISSTVALDMRGGALFIQGSSTADTSQSVSSTTLANGGTSTISLTSGAGHSVTLNLGAITRANGSQDGTLRVILPVSGAVTTTSGNVGTTGVLGGWATVTDAFGTWFATNSAGTGLGNIVAVATTAKNDVSTWLAGDQITDSTAGFTGTISGANINTLRFDAAGGSALNIADGSLLNIVSGGIMVTSNVSTGPVSISGGALAAVTNELIFIQDSSRQMTVSSAIRTNYALTKAGAGTLLLTGNNNYNDETEIQSGILQVNGRNAIGDTSLVTLADDAPAMLQLLSDETIGRLQGGSATAGIDQLAVVDIGTHSLTINETASTTYAGVFTGSGNLIKTGTGNLQFTNATSGFTGAITVNMGLLYFSGIGSSSASSYMLNSGSSLMIDNNGTTTVGTRILDTASITLNSANGSWSGETIISGLSIRRNQASALNETVGVITAMSGANYARLEATVASAAGAIIADNIVRQNGATLDVRGTNMSATTGTRAQLRIGTAANQTSFIASMIGGGSTTLGTKNISIVSWAIAEDTVDAGVADINTGNSLATYVAGQGFRALNLATEYNTYAAAGLTDNVRESLGADVTGLAGKTLNAIVIDNMGFLNDVNFLGAGAGQKLTNTSGTFLFTLSQGATAGAAYSTTLGGFDSGIAVAGTNEYVLFVVNPSSAAGTATLTAAISSALISVADITKSGRGTLALTGINTAGGGSRKTTINEGAIEITDLDNIGGSSGALVFAGGTLRLSSSYAGDDISTRSITFLNGGGTIDTNGIDLMLANSVGSGTGGFTKAGLGNLTLTAAATYTGSTTVSGGLLTLGADNAIGIGGDLTIGGGAALDTGGFHVTAGLVSTTGASPAILGFGTITATSGFSFGNTGDIGIDAILAGSGGLLKTQTNVLTLIGLNTFSGPIEVQAGTLSFNTITNVGGGASALGSVTNAQDGIIHMGFTTAVTTLSYTGAGSSSDRIIGMQGTTGGVVIDASGTGALTLGGARVETAGAKSLTLKGASDPSLANTMGAINEYGLGALSLIKADQSTWVLSAANSYSGSTSINEGILRFTADQNLSGALNFGSANSITTAGTLDLSSASATFAGAMLVQTNSATETDKLIVGAGESLTVGGTVTLGSGATNSTTLFSASGEGAFNVINTTGTGVTFLVGNSNTNIATADFSALATMNVSLNTTSGILQVGSTSGTNSTGFGTLILAQNTTITASALTVGGGGSYNSNFGQVNSLKLGTATNVIHADAVNIGTGARDLGSITFLDSNGTVTIRAADGVSASAFNMASINGATGATLPTGNRNTFDVSGHNADLLFSTMTIGTQNTRTGPIENLFAFDMGTLTAGNLVMGSKTAAGNSTNVINLGGGIVTIGSGTGTAATLASNTSTGVVSATINVTGGTVTIGSGSGQALLLGSGNTNATGSTSSALNVSGGNVTLATTGSTALTMAAASAGTANATIGISGGTLTVQGAILRGTGLGTRNATINLNGGTLDMSGKAVGASGNAITFNAQSGTLKNLAELNGGGAFNKTTADTLYMDGVNTYTGTTTVTAGRLQFLKETALYNNNSAQWTDTNIVVNAAATAAFNVGGTGEFTAADVDAIKTLGTNTGGFKDGSAIGLDTTNASGGNFTYGGVIANTNGGVNAVGFTKLGTNTLTLTNTNTYTGPTTVAAGTLQVGDGTSGALAGAGNVTVSTAATLSGSGSIAGGTVISSGAFLAPGVGVTASSNQMLTFTSNGIAVDVRDGGQIQLGLTSSSQIDSAFNASGTDALTYLNANGGAAGTAYTSIWAQSGDYDTIKLTNGTFNLGSTAGGTIKLLSNGLAVSNGSIFKLLDWSSVGNLDSLAGSGSFTVSDLDLSSLLGSGLSFDTSAFTTYGVIVVTGVPEPSRMMLLMLGICGFMLRRRR